MPGEASGLSTVASPRGPTISANISRVTAPGRSKTGLDPEKSTTVDSIPTVHGPPSSIISTRPPSSLMTCSAWVGLIRPERLALGAAIGRAARANRSCARGCPGTRSAMLSNPAEVSQAIGQSVARLTTILSGPGQKRSATALAAGLKSPSEKAHWAWETCEISGLKRGRPFASKIRATAVASVASAPSP